MTFVDTGKGVKEEHLKELFTPFYNQRKGIGLGLLQYYKLLKLIVAILK